MPPGSKVLDPFAGVSLGALEALRLGCTWVGCELEPRFYLTGMSNIAKWMHEYRHLPGWGPWAMCVNGDSRRLLEHIPAPSACAISSPPWTNQEPSHAQGSSPSGDRLRAEPPATRGQRFLDATYGTTPGQLATMPAPALAISSPPFGSGDSAGPESLHRRTDVSAKAMLKDQGWHGGGQVSPGNLAGMSMAVASPPYAGSIHDTGQHTAAVQAKVAETRKKTGKHWGLAMTHQSIDAYGHTEGQLGAMDMAVSSPPYVDSVNSQEHGIDWDKTGPWRGKRKRGKGTKHEATLRAQMAYGTSEGQLGAMAPGMVVSSPPFTSTTASDWHLDSSPGRFARLYANYKANGGGMTEAQFRAHCEKRQDGYGTTEGNLAHLSVSSPPYSTSTQVNNTPGDMTAGKARWAGGADSAARVKQDYADLETPGNLATLSVSSPPYADGCGQQGHDYHPERMVGTRTGYIQRDHAGYGTSQGQLADELPNNFWAASETILAQAFALLRPGGHAIFVTKRYVRSGKIVEFTQDWIRCCESVGFRLLHHHKAMLVEHHGTQTTLFGEGDTVHETRRESFFRRLARMKGSPAIEWEDVTCFIRPEESA